MPWWVLVRGADGARIPVEVTAPAGATVGELADALAGIAGEDQGGELEVIPAGTRGDAATRRARDEEIDGAVVPGDLLTVVPLPGSRELAPVVSLEVVTGDDAGAIFPLAQGSHVVGSAEGAAVLLADPLVAPRHARVVVGTSVQVSDLGSTTGIAVGGRPVSRATLDPGDLLSVGATVLRLTAVQGVGRGASPDATTARPQSRVILRTTRVLPPPPDRLVEPPEPPHRAAKRPMPRAALLGAVALALVMVVTTGRVASLAFAALGPALMIGSAVDARLSRRREEATALAEFTQRCTHAEAELAWAAKQARVALEARFPHRAAWEAAANDQAGLLWSRRTEEPHWGQLRLGTGTVAAGIVAATQRQSPAGLAAAVAAREQLVARWHSLEEAPVTVDPAVVGGLGIGGVAAADACRALLWQYVCLHSPQDAAVVALVRTRDASEWGFLAFLPHTVLAGADADLVAAWVERTIEARAGKALPAVRPRPRGPIIEASDSAAAAMAPVVFPTITVVIDPQCPVPLARLIRLAELGPDVGVHVWWVSGDRASIPAACRTVVTVGDAVAEGGHTATALVESARHGTTVQGVRMDLLTPADAMDRARLLAPCVDAAAMAEEDAALPDCVTMIDLHGAALASSERGPMVLARRWRATAPRAGGTLRALVGVDADGPTYLDLVTQGPHALVGGTTGSGKSEFLQTWILAMAAAHGPHAVNFLLVDYKGGSAFAECAQLPHCVGLMTDLKGHLAPRVLASLRSELRHRETVLSAAGVKDIDSLHRSKGADALARLVIVIDEFAALASEVPEFIDGVVDIAQRGRSLGLHLILATQRPAGVIRDNIRANCSLRIALRMADDADSLDVVGIPDAARSASVPPGRAWVRSAPGKVSTVQVAHAGGPVEVASLASRSPVRGAPWGGAAPGFAPPRGSLAGDPAAAAGGQVADSSASAAVVAVMTAAADLRVPGEKPFAPPRRPWLPPLPDVIHRQDLEDAAAFGLADDPATQYQGPAVVRSDAGLTLVVGAPGSGKSTALRSLAAAHAQAALAHGRAVRMYGIDAGHGGLEALRAEAPVGDIVSAHDEERLWRLMTSLTAAREGGDGEVETVIVIDGLGAMLHDSTWQAAADGIAGGFATRLASLLGSATSRRVRVIASVDRWGAIPPVLQAAVTRTIALRLGDEAQYAVLGLRSTDLGDDAPPGRAIDLPGRTVLQVALPAQATGLAAVAPPIASLPAVVSGSLLASELDGLPVLGIDAMSLEACGFVPDQPILIAGRRASGASNAAAWLAWSMRRAYRDAVVVRCAARGALAKGGPWDLQVLGQHGASQLATWWRDDGVHLEAGRAVIVLEGIGDFVGAPSEVELAEALRAARRAGQLIIGEGPSPAWSPSAVTMEFRSARRGLVLGADAMDAQLLCGASPQRLWGGDVPAGRGWWCEGGTAHLVQLPLVDDGLSTAAPHGQTHGSHGGVASHVTT